MKFAKRMDRFGEGVFSMLAQMKYKRLEEGKEIVDLSIGAPNIPPAASASVPFRARISVWCFRSL